MESHFSFLKPHAGTINALMIDNVFDGIKDEGEAAELLGMISDTFQHSRLVNVDAFKSELKNLYTKTTTLNKALLN